MPMLRGGTAADAMPRMRARGVSPCAFAAASDATMSAAAPSLTPEALPAVTVPGLRNGVLSLASCSSVVSGRGCSSASIVTTSPLRPATSTGTISPLKKPAAIARHGFGQAREQQRHARDVAIVLAGLVGAAEIDVVELLPIRLRIARHQRLER